MGNLLVNGKDHVFADADCTVDTLRIIPSADVVGRKFLTIGSVTPK